MTERSEKFIRNVQILKPAESKGRPSLPRIYVKRR